MKSNVVRCDFNALCTIDFCCTADRKHHCSGLKCLYYWRDIYKYKLDKIVNININKHRYPWIKSHEWVSQRTKSWVHYLKRAAGTGSLSKIDRKGIKFKTSAMLLRYAAKNINLPLAKLYLQASYCKKCFWHTAQWWISVDTALGREAENSPMFVFLWNVDLKT